MYELYQKKIIHFDKKKKIHVWVVTRHGPWALLLANNKQSMDVVFFFFFSEFFWIFSSLIKKRYGLFTFIFWSAINWENFIKEKFYTIQ